MESTNNDLLTLENGTEKSRNVSTELPLCAS